MRFAALRRCGAVEKRGRASSGLLSNETSGPFLGCRKGIDSACCTARCHPVPRVGSVPAGSLLQSRQGWFPPPLSQLRPGPLTRVGAPRVCEARRGMWERGGGVCSQGLGGSRLQPRHLRGPAPLPPRRQRFPAGPLFLVDTAQPRLRRPGGQAEGPVHARAIPDVASLTTGVLCKEQERRKE